RSPWFPRCVRVPAQRWLAKAAGSGPARDERVDGSWWQRGFDYGVPFLPDEAGQEEEFAAPLHRDVLQITVRVAATEMGGQDRARTLEQGDGQLRAIQTELM